MKLLVINGPNLNMLGIREPHIYGNKTYNDLCDMISDYCKEKEIEVEFYQSNHEGCLVDKIQEAYGNTDGIVINPGAYTHTSVALLDAVKTVDIPTVEVHISDPDTREEFRKVSYIRAACIATVKGKGFDGYIEAVSTLILNNFLTAKAEMRCNIPLFRYDDAVEFIKLCTDNQRAVTGIDSFKLTDNTTQPVMEHSIDFSDSFKADNQQAMNFIEAKSNLNLVFEIVYE